MSSINTKRKKFLERYLLLLSSANAVLADSSMICCHGQPELRAYGTSEKTSILPFLSASQTSFCKEGAVHMKRVLPSWPPSIHAKHICLDLTRCVHPLPSLVAPSVSLRTSFVVGDATQQAPASSRQIPSGELPSGSSAQSLL